MKPNLLVSFFAPKASARNSASRNKRILDLQAQGFQVQRCADIPALHKYVQASAQANTPPAVILAGTLAQNCSAATYLRALHPGTGIVATVDPAKEADVIHLLQSGVDNYFSRQDSSALLAAILFRLFARAGADIAPRKPAAAARAGVWSLQEQAWKLESPDGVRVALTTGERAFLMVLFQAPDLRATHRELADAVNQDYALASSPAPQGRLGVLVSRMRRKFANQGAPLPLKSLHNWGYMFTGPAHHE
ncbi:MAG: helix-turn-helix domain-containing protein [Pusillimonas sp.]